MHFFKKYRQNGRQTAFWLCYYQLWPIIEGRASLTQCLSEFYRKSLNEVGSLGLTDRLVVFELGTCHNSITTLWLARSLSPYAYVCVCVRVCVYVCVWDVESFSQGRVKVGFGNFHKVNWGFMEMVEVLLLWWVLITFQLHISFMAVLHASVSSF